MHFLSNPDVDAGAGRSLGEEALAVRVVARDRQAAAVLLQAAASATNHATRRSLRQRAAHLILPAAPRRVTRGGRDEVERR